MLWLICILSAISITICNGYKTEMCNIVNFDYKQYEREYIVDGCVSRPFQLTYNQKSNTLLFHEDSEVLRETKTYVVDLNTKAVKEIGVEHALGSIVDDAGNYIIATNNGLFKYQPTTDALELSSHRNYSFYNIYKFNGKVYFIDFPKKDLYVIDKGVTKNVIQGKNIEAFALDSADNFYYGNASGIFYGNLRIPSVDYVEQSDNTPFDDFVINPGNEIAFVLSHYGVFKINRDSGTLKRISTKAMLDLVFDKNGSIIYSDEEHIVRLKTITTLRQG